LSTILDSYVNAAASPQQTIDIFKGEWSSILPPELDASSGGGAGVFDDGRIHWFLGRTGPLAGRSVVELGPLEGGHTCMLERAGADSILAIESNTRAFLKCLIVKELLGLERSRFLLADFVEQLAADERCYDIGIASGVIYHMRNPARLIELLALRCREVLVWTHYYDAAVAQAKPALKQTFVEPQAFEHAGFRHTLVPKNYGAALGWQGFCGGSADYACWMPRQDLLDCFAHFGFEVTGIEFDHPDHPNGPALALHAVRRGG
jgi:hypothetical protein